MRRARTLLIVTSTLVLGLLLIPVTAYGDGPGVNPGLDPAWEKYPAGTAMITTGTSKVLGQPYSEVGTIPEESWVADVWDGGATDVYPGNNIAGYYGADPSLFGEEGQVYANWYLDACYYPTRNAARVWFRTTLDLAFQPTSVRMVRKYYPAAAPQTAGFLPINDDLFVWVNGAKTSAGGVSIPFSGDYGLAAGWSGLYVNQNGGGSLETAYLGLQGGLVLPGDKFTIGSNTIEVMTDDICRGGALPHPVFQLEAECAGFEPPLDEDISIRKNNRVLPLKMRIVDGLGNYLTDAQIAAPVLEIDYTPATPGDQLPEGDLFVGQGDEGNLFVYSGGKWQFNLKINKDFAPGTYAVYPKGTDGLSLGASCQATFVIQ